MRNNIKILSIILLLIIGFSVYYSLDSSKETKVVFIDEELDSKQIVDKLYKEGYINNKLSYYILSFNAKFTDAYENGGYDLSKGMGALALHSRLINPEYKYVYIEEGLRTEQVAEEIGEYLDWDQEKVKKFSETKQACSFVGTEGFFQPGKYAIHKDELVSVVKKQMTAEMEKYINEIADDKIQPEIDEIVKIASLIQREAASKNDMRLISGIIWNRLEEGMPLQIDATLQYVKGSQEVWWPMVHPKDKYLESPYNTYQNKGLPPTAIANPGKAAVLAALNPVKTSCIYYLHDKRGNIHCSKTYEGHKRNIDYYLR